MQSLLDFAQMKTEESISSGRRRILKQCIDREGPYVVRNKKKLLSFSCNDYLGLAQHPGLKEAAIAAVNEWGSGACASRLVTGNHSLYEELEKEIASLKNSEAAIVLGSGYLANLGIIPALASKGDLIVADRLVHSSIISGCILSGAKLLRFGHNSALSCNEILRKHRKNYRNCLIITEHVFSMDGDIAPITDIMAIAKDYDAWVMTDDAHGLGVCAQGEENNADIQMGTFSKAVGSYGGYVCAKKEVIDYLIGAIKTLVYSTALPPAVVASSIAALKIIKHDKKLCAKPLQNALLFTKLMGLDYAKSPIVPLIVGDEKAALQLENYLENKGFLVVAIRPPTVPPKTARLRLAFSALHHEGDIAKLADAIKSFKIA